MTITVAAPKFAGSRNQAKAMLESIETDEPIDTLLVDFYREGPVAPGFIQGVVEQTIGHEAWLPCEKLVTAGLDLDDSALFLYVADAHDRGRDVGARGRERAFHTRAAVLAAIMRSETCRKAVPPRVPCLGRSDIAAVAFGGSEKALDDFLDGKDVPVDIDVLAAAIMRPDLIDAAWLSGDFLYRAARGTLES